MQTELKQKGSFSLFCFVRKMRYAHKSYLGQLVIIPKLSIPFFLQSFGQFSPISEFSIVNFYYYFKIKTQNLSFETAKKPTLKRKKKQKSHKISRISYD